MSKVDTATAPPPAKRQRTSVDDAVEADTANLPVVRIGGVPEHFNYPFQLARELGLDTKYGVRIEFVVQACGTGAMISAVKEKEVDLIVALTEGLVADIAKGGSDVRILGTYVASPLCWAISAAGHTSAAAGDAEGAETKAQVIAEVADLRNKTFGISRYGSGSHLMANVLALQRGWDPQKDVNFKVVGKFKALRDSVNSGETHAFMWETFTTKPFHDSGEVRRVGDITTPWPCFMVAGLKTVVGERIDAIRAALAAVHEAAMVFHGAQPTLPSTEPQSAADSASPSSPHPDAPTMPAKIAERYGLKLEDAETWYAGVRIAAHRYVSDQAIVRALEALVSAGVLPPGTTTRPEDVIDPRIAELKPTDIRKVRLYRSSSSLIRRVNTSLAAAGKERGPITFRDLLSYDQHHYDGTRAVDEAIRLCNIAAGDKIINIGSGLGGPARYIAGTTGCEVLACELQHDLHDNALALTERCGMADRVAHVAGDFAQVQRHLAAGTYRAVVSWLTVLHIADRRSLFKACYKLLRPGGVFYAADFVARRPLTVQERKTLREEVYCTDLATLEQYCDELRSAGFRVKLGSDRSARWTELTASRADSWSRHAQQIEATSGSTTQQELGDFYNMIRDLFASGCVGGIVVAAEKPLGW